MQNYYYSADPNYMALPYGQHPNQQQWNAVYYSPVQQMYYQGGYPVSSYAPSMAVPEEQYQTQLKRYYGTTERPQRKTGATKDNNTRRTLFQADPDTGLTCCWFFYNQGFCLKGDACAFPHVPRRATDSASASSTPEGGAKAVADEKLEGEDIGEKADSEAATESKREVDAPAEPTKAQGSKKASPNPSDKKKKEKQKVPVAGQGQEEHAKNAVWKKRKDGKGG